MTQAAARAKRTEAAAVGSALRLCLVRLRVQEGTLRVGALANTLEEGALRDVAIVVLVQVEAVVPVDTGAAQPVLAHLRLYGAVRRDDVPLRARIAQAAATALEVLANL